MHQVGYVRDEDDEYELLVISDEAAQEWLEIQRSFEHDEQDAALGMDTYCLVRDSAATHYGGVVLWNLAADRLTVHLTPDAAAVLGVPRRIHFTVDAEGQALVREHLPRLLS
jgi:hypothetical protein